MTDLSFWLGDGVLPFYCYLMVVIIDSRKTFLDLANGVFPFLKEESEVPNHTAMASKLLSYKEVAMAPRGTLDITINIVLGIIPHSIL